MGLASFNRMRRQRAAVEMTEAERFKIAHAAREGGRRARLDAHRANRARVDDVRGQESDAMQRIGELNRAGLDNNDIPMRREHAAEIAGRNLQDVQEPKDPVERVAERLPAGTHNEELVGSMNADGPGPDPALLDKARDEAGATNPDARARQRGQRRLREAGETRQPEPRPRRQRAAADSNRSAALTERSKVEIPSNWRDISWPAKRSLGAKVADGKINKLAEAEAAIEAELKRRG